MERKLPVLPRLANKYLQINIFNLAHISLKDLLIFLHKTSRTSRRIFLLQNYKIILQITKFFSFLSPFKLIIKEGLIRNGYNQIYNSTIACAPLTITIKDDESIKALQKYYQLALENKAIIVFDKIEVYPKKFSKELQQDLVGIIKQIKVKNFMVKYQFNWSYERQKMIICFHKIPKNIDEFIVTVWGLKLLERLNAQYKYVKHVEISGKANTNIVRRTYLVPSLSEQKLPNENSFLEKNLSNFYVLNNNYSYHCSDCKEPYLCKKQCIFAKIPRNIKTFENTIIRNYSALQTKSETLIIQGEGLRSIELTSFGLQQMNHTVQNLILQPVFDSSLLSNLEFSLTHYSALVNLTLDFSPTKKIRQLRKICANNYLKNNVKMTPVNIKIQTALIAASANRLKHSQQFLAMKQEKQFR
ncbi:hypothetical protein FGO68_gene4771 [Halteria grandinella]|uniref:Uncharacterized protein n=1 Tax=Halteria grandinella TaxID=5974 RepID=A0A8J8NUP0_HALGN|nr:hypothetical protein FGO68_gene4771 [Halteria grandinella]